MSDSTKKEIKDILKYFDTKFLFFGSQKTQNHYRKFLKKSLHSIATQSWKEGYEAGEKSDCKEMQDLTKEE